MIEELHSWITDVIWKHIFPCSTMQALAYFTLSYQTIRTQ